ncbi:hypothetical protein [Saccharopolyspora erythraea]|uniref:hypothetical protein n=1 Tax=Saccharopolyspora erythraea TaxID=1836 RepID=UPI00117A0CF3|nr:hypothetical protein [Saccharopolyspora erythraea]QRK91724.1 hypothetical protein JQX30_10265 [Saccharopolyspora erythraea]
MRTTGPGPDAPSPAETVLANSATRTSSPENAGTPSRAMRGLAGSARRCRGAAPRAGAAAGTRSAVGTGLALGTGPAGEAGLALGAVALA